MCDNGKKGASQSQLIAFTKMCFTLSFRFCSSSIMMTLLYHQCVESRKSIRNNKLQSKIFEVILYDNDNCKNAFAFLLLGFSFDFRLDSKTSLDDRSQVVNETPERYKKSEKRKEISNWQRSISGSCRSALFNIGTDVTCQRGRIHGPAGNLCSSINDHSSSFRGSNFCPKCSLKFDRLSDLRTHMIRVCGFKSKKMCPYCDTVGNTVDQIHRHIERRHPNLCFAVLEMYNINGN